MIQVHLSSKLYLSITPARFVIFISPILTLSNIAYAATFADCPENFYAATVPDYLDNKLLNQSVELCFNGFATLYSGLSHTPIWSAEHLTRDRLNQAQTIPRDDSFHSESRLPSSMRASLSDYKGSGYDRGHLAPNADMATIAQQYDSFSLANMIPQSPTNNRYVWRNLESVTRYLTKQYGETYVITGVTFKGSKIVQIGTGLLVPTHVFKAVYIPAIAEAGVYYAPNDDSERIEVISIDELALRTNIDLFPSIDPASKANALDLALKVSEITDDGDTSKPTQDPWWLQLLIALVDWIVYTLSK